MMQRTTGTAWLTSIALSEVLGWAAVYWLGAGKPQAYTSIRVPSTNDLDCLFDPDPEDLPGVGLQTYCLFYRRDRHLYTFQFDGYDTYYLFGREVPVEGFYLSDKDWEWLTRVSDRDVYGRRGLWGQDFDDWQNEVPV